MTQSLSALGWSVRTDGLLSGVETILAIVPPDDYDEEMGIMADVRSFFEVTYKVCLIPSQVSLSPVIFSKDVVLRCVLLHGSHGTSHCIAD